MSVEKFNDIIVKPLSDGKTWELVKPYTRMTSHGLIFIPDGYKFDFASIPRIVWGLYPPATGKYRASALVHDWLCDTGHDWVESAEIMRELMYEDGVPTLRRNIIYYSVRSFELFHETDWGHANLLLIKQQEKANQLGIKFWK